MSSVNNQLTTLFESNEFVGHRKIIISSEGTSMRNSLERYLRPNDVIYAEVMPNPSLSQLSHFFGVVNPREEDIVFAIGGGSVIDFAKLVSLFSQTQITEIKAIIETEHYSVINKVLKLVVVPTLFGSGAEQTPFAVCYIGNKKFSVASSLLLPEKVVYIPELNLSATSKIKLANVLDCFCQAAESITAQNATRRSIILAEEVLRLLITIANEYINNDNAAIAEKMSKASELCGKAIAISKTTGPHAMSYYLTSTLKWDHGVAVGFVFIYFSEMYSQFRDTDRSIEKLFNVLLSILKDQSVESFFTSIGLNIEELSSQLIKNVDINLWVKSVNLERLSNGPKIDLSWLNAEDIRLFYSNKIQ